MGLHHGAYCVGCCWALMLLLFVTGVMNLLWVAIIAAFVLLEKVVPSRATPWVRARGTITAEFACPVVRRMWLRRPSETAGVAGPTLRISRPGSGRGRRANGMRKPVVIVPRALSRLAGGGLVVWGLAVLLV